MAPEVSVPSRTSRSSGSQLLPHWDGLATGTAIQSRVMPPFAKAPPAAVGRSNLRLQSFQSREVPPFEGPFEGVELRRSPICRAARRARVCQRRGPRTIAKINFQVRRCRIRHYSLSGAYQPHQAIHGQAICCRRASQSVPRPRAPWPPPSADTPSPTAGWALAWETSTFKNYHPEDSRHSGRTSSSSSATNGFRGSGRTTRATSTTSSWSTPSTPSRRRCAGSRRAATCGGTISPSPS